MKSVTKQIIYLLSFLTLATSSSPKCPNDLTLHHPTNCSRFFVCSSGIWMEKECPAGLHFSGVLGNCEWPATANCVLKGLETSVDSAPQSMVCDAKLLRGKLVNHINDCTKFYSCNGKWFEHKCPAGLHFSEAANRCEWPAIAGCSSSQSFQSSQTKCQLEDQLHAHPTDCSRFYICSGGFLVDLTCSYGLLFSLAHGRCVTSNLANCLNHQQPLPATPSVRSCQQDNALYTHPRLCEMFYICSGGFLVEQTCSYGTKFSAPHGKCVAAQDAICFA